MESLKVIALISGGKDSLFSILHCLKNDHTIVALANLYPPSINDEDLNSYMYQTVGHRAIPLYEEALGIPLYREEIQGEAANSARDYSVQEAQEAHDETESLLPLLMKIKDAHPEANAISTGAILSTYQRTRVESVALRLNLTPLSYLWQYTLLPPYKQTSLLYDMAAINQDARIIKVASAGLDESFLWANVADHKTITRMSKAIARFSENSNGTIVGEGGEFETLAIDGPKALWKKRIEIEPDSVSLQDGGAAILKCKNAKLVDKFDGEEERLETLRIPNLFDAEFENIFDELPPFNSALVQPPIPSSPVRDARPYIDTEMDAPATFTYFNMTGGFVPWQLFCFPERLPNTSSRQLSDIFERLTSALSQADLERSDIAHCTLILRNMSDFVELNKVYANYFSHINPPARVTVAVGDALLEGYDVMLSVILDKERLRGEKGLDRQGLHVQSRSYWAPANIGPYSQAISTRLPLPSFQLRGPLDTEDEEAGEIVYVAGQIPLVPASMEVYNEKGFEGQAVLSLQHLWRIGRVKGVKWWTSGVAYISDCKPKEAEVRIHIIQAAWRAIHTQWKIKEEEDDDDDVDIDPWDLRNQGLSFNDDTMRADIPDRTVVSSGYPPCFVVQVQSLPRGVDIEWSSTGLTSPLITFSRPDQHQEIRLTVTKPKNSRCTFYTSEFTHPSDFQTKNQLVDSYYHGSTIESSHGIMYTDKDFASAAALSNTIIVPCKAVWGENGGAIRAVYLERVDECLPKVEEDDDDLWSSAKQDMTESQNTPIVKKEELSPRQGESRYWIKPVVKEEEEEE